tara:strand:+ start:8508 stop:9158 length:651 start_codon:yes stop_codon:yes gene_type:complete
MNGLIEPNLHPLIVHFVIAFLITGPLLLLLAALTAPESKWRQSAYNAGDWMIGLGLLALVAAIAAGFQAYYSVAHDGPSHAAMTDHRNWAIVTATFYLAIGLYRLYTRKKAPNLLLAVLFLVPVTLLTITGWKGGHLVYGYGLGVASLPAVAGEGHDHEHAPGIGHAESVSMPAQHHGDKDSDHNVKSDTADQATVPERHDSDSGEDGHAHQQHDH